MRLFFVCGGEILRKLKKYKPTKFKTKTSVYDKDAADYAVMFIESLCHTKAHGQENRLNSSTGKNKLSVTYSEH